MCCMGRAIGWSAGFCLTLWVTVDMAPNILAGLAIGFAFCFTGACLGQWIDNR